MGWDFITLAQFEVLEMFIGLIQNFIDGYTKP